MDLTTCCPFCGARPSEKMECPNEVGSFKCPKCDGEFNVTSDGVRRFVIMVKGEVKLEEATKGT